MNNRIAKLSNFSKNEDGTVAVIFAFVVVVLLFAVGIMIDSARAYHASARTLTALDAAALAAAKGRSDGGLSDDEVKDLAKDFFKANSAAAVEKGIRYGELAVTLDGEAGVTVTVDGAIPTTLTAVLDIKEIKFTETATVIFDSKDIELSLMLDVTGSMRGSKIEALKGAAKTLIDILMPEGKSDRTRIALAPYSASVNAGEYAHEVSDGESQDGCIVGRQLGSSHLEDAPQGGKYFPAIVEANSKIRHDKDEKGYDYYQCPNAKIMPLSNDAGELINRIDRYRTDGRTAGHLGIAWAWYMISPDWAHIWGGDSRPEEYGTKDLMKVVVLMTDGKFNAAYSGSDYKSEATNASYDHAKDLCDAMKDDEDEQEDKKKNIMIFAVAFDAPYSAQQTLKACVANGGKFYKATNGAALEEAFRDIAVKLSNIRIKS